MKCNHCQFDRNLRLHSRLNLDVFTLHHCALNGSCGGWVSSFIIVYYGYVSGEAISSVCREFSLWCSYPSCWPPEAT